MTADDGHEHRGGRERHPRVDHVEEPAEHGPEHQRALPRERLAGGEPRQATAVTVSAGSERVAGVANARAVPKPITRRKIGRVDVGSVLA